MVVQQREPIDQHIAHIRTVRQAGAEPPPEWVALHERYVSYYQLQTPVRDALVAAVLSGNGDVAGLRAGAYSEAVVAPPQIQVNHHVAEAVHRRLVELYAPVAVDVYQQIALRFDMVAAEFAAAAGAVDVEASAEEVIRASEKERNAWGEAPVIAGRLDQLQGPLRAAAELAGRSTKQREVQLALCVDPNGAHRRRVWESFERPPGGRGGRWTAILKCGAQIKAADIDTIQPYRRPAALVENMKQVNGMIVREVTDPEDRPADRPPKPGPLPSVSVPTP